MGHSTKDDPNLFNTHDKTEFFIQCGEWFGKGFFDKSNYR